MQWTCLWFRREEADVAGGQVVVFVFAPVRGDVITSAFSALTLFYINILKQMGTGLLSTLNTELHKLLLYSLILIWQSYIFQSMFIFSADPLDILCN